MCSKIHFKDILFIHEDDMKEMCLLAKNKDF